MADYIRRDLAYKAMCETRCGKDKGLCVSSPENCLALKMIAAIPSEDVVPAVHGQWLYNSLTGKYFCSACGNGAYTKKFVQTAKCCPLCETRMEVDRHV